MKNFAFLFLMLLSLPASANYAMNGQCFATSQEALDSFVSGYPKLVTTSGSSTNQINTWHSVNTASISTSAAGQYLFVSMRFNNTNQTSLSIPVANCTILTNSYDYSAGGALWAFAFSFVLGLWFVSKNIGLVIESVRKF